MDWDKVYTPASRRSDPPAPVRVRTIWIMAKSDRLVTAAIFDVVSGRELRIYSGGNPDSLIESTLSRDGDERLERRAADLREAMLERGWTEQ